MSLEDDLAQELIQGYRRAGEEVGYWGTRFLQSVRKHGGLATAKRMLTKRNKGQRLGLDALLAAGRPDLSLEAIIQQPRFRPLFTPEEIQEAVERVGRFREESARRIAEREGRAADTTAMGVLSAASCLRRCTGKLAKALSMFIISDRLPLPMASITWTRSRT